MKKTYINPAMEIVKVQTQQMLAASGGFGVGQKDGGVAAGRDLFLDFED